MDPNTALDNILRGYMIAEHAAALQDWLAGGGFVPAQRAMPDDCARFALAHCGRHYAGMAFASISVRATRDGLWTMPPGGSWISLAIWNELLRID
jgi:hypothetical protein